MTPSPPRVALVTGANRGIGRAIATELTRRGLRVVPAARRHTDADEVATQLDTRGVRIDLFHPGTITAAVDKITAWYGRVDVLINNAGITDGNQRPSAADSGLVDEVWQVNVAGPWRCVSAVVPLMREHGYGRIVNMSSTLGSLHHMSRPTEPAYRVSKAALNALTRVLAAELIDDGILVNAASPGWVRTDMGGPTAPRDVTDGADTPAWLATLPDDGPTGGLFLDREPLEW